MNNQRRRSPASSPRQPSQPAPSFLDDNLAEQLAEQIVLQYVQPGEDDPATSELRAYLDSQELNPPFLNRKDFLSEKSLSRKIVGLPSFLRAVQNQREEVLDCLSMPEGPGKPARALRIWEQEAIF